MYSQQNKLRELFEQRGWELIETREIDDIAVVEMWPIRSTWSPTDCMIFLSFETDPQDWYLQRQEGKLKVHWIKASLQKPLDWMAESTTQFEKNDVFDDRTCLYFGGSPEKKLPEFFKDLANMRQKFYNFYN